MALLSTDDLMVRFEKHISYASEIDIAVAWVGPSPALELLRAKTRSTKIKVRVAVGLSGNSTVPEAVRTLQEFADVRVAHGNAGIFHPKFYLFRSQKESVCWVGSANFTLGGFVVNSELVNEFGDDGAGHQWFNLLWDSLDEDSTDEIDRYVAGWERPPGGTSSKEPPTSSAMDEPLKLMLARPRSWNAYITALRSCDDYWNQKSSNEWEKISVLAAEWSWIETIATGGNLLRRNNWESFTDEEINVLLGYRRGGEGDCRY